MGLFIKIWFLKIRFTVNHITDARLQFHFISLLKLQGFIELLVYSK